MIFKVCLFLGAYLGCFNLLMTMSNTVLTVLNMSSADWGSKTILFPLSDFPWMTWLTLLKSEFSFMSLEISDCVISTFVFS